MKIILRSRAMRRASFTGVSSGGGPGEPLIVVEESGGIAEEEEDESKTSSPAESPSVNQYLLTPWRDMRKRSLPTPPCTSGITASQVCERSRKRYVCVKNTYCLRIISITLMNSILKQFARFQCYA